MKSLSACVPKAMPAARGRNREIISGFTFPSIVGPPRIFIKEEDSIRPGNTNNGAIILALIITSLFKSRINQGSSLIQYQIKISICIKQHNPDPTYHPR
jgi:hypothetical protein